MMLKMILFAYSRAIYSGRKIVQMNEEMIPMKWLTNDQYVGYHSINDFRVHLLTATLIRKAFVHFYSLLKEHQYVNEEAIFIDGTKLEADANRYSFVWRKSIEKHEAKLNQEVATLYVELVKNEINSALQEDELQSSVGIEAMIKLVKKPKSYRVVLLINEKEDGLKNTLESFPRIIFQENTNTKKRISNSMVETVIPKRIKMPLLCV